MGGFFAIIVRDWREYYVYGANCVERTLPRVFHSESEAARVATSLMQRGMVACAKVRYVP